MKERTSGLDPIVINRRFDESMEFIGAVDRGIGRVKDYFSNPYLYVGGVVPLINGINSETQQNNLSVEQIRFISGFCTSIFLTGLEVWQNKKDIGQIAQAAGAGFAAGYFGSDLVMDASMIRNNFQEELIDRVSFPFAAFALGLAARNLLKKGSESIREKNIQKSEQNELQNNLSILIQSAINNDMQAKRELEKMYGKKNATLITNELRKKSPEDRNVWIRNKLVRPTKSDEES